jgi:hypothetical protein
MSLRCQRVFKKVAMDGVLAKTGPLEGIMRFIRLMLLTMVVMTVGCFRSPVSEDLGNSVQALDFPTGSLQGAVLWNGAAIGGLGTRSTFVYVPDVTGAYVGEDGRYSLPNLIPGSYDVSAYADGCTGNGPLGTVVVTALGGSVTTADIDITQTAGRLSGQITVNGVPLPNPSIQVGACGGFRGRTSDETGHFADYYPPGTYTAYVDGDSGRIGSFTFSVVAGQTTDVDMGTTNPGANVDVELSGGLTSVGGLAVTFSTVTAGGNTTVVESGAGPPPPTGYRIVGLAGQPRYWDINSTASFTGEIEVCIKYEAFQVHGQESNLRLMHDAGQGLTDITVSIDTNADVICGITTSLSPFAVVEPLAPPDRDADGIRDAEDKCASTRAGAVANSDGCSIDDLVPCDGSTDGDWKNHGAYMRAYSMTATQFCTAGLIGSATRDALVAAAAQSSCGARR